MLLASSCLAVTLGCGPALANDPDAKPDGKEISSFEDCVAAGNMVLRTYPGRCVTSDGRTFVEKAAPLENIGGLKPGKQPEGGGSACKDLCGDGVCQEIVCQALGCPCAETASTCPKDCR
jgi:hypothetical protein